MYHQCCIRKLAFSNLQALPIPHIFFQLQCHLGMVCRIGFVSLCLPLWKAAATLLISPSSFFFWVVHELPVSVCVFLARLHVGQMYCILPPSLLFLFFVPPLLWCTIGLGSSPTLATEVTRYRPCLYVCVENIQTCEYVQVR